MYVRVCVCECMCVHVCVLPSLVIVMDITILMQWSLFATGKEWKLQYHQ